MSRMVRAEDLKAGMVIDAGGCAELEEVWRWPDGMVGIVARELSSGLSACYRPGDLVCVTTDALTPPPTSEGLMALRRDTARARMVWLRSGLPSAQGLPL